MSLLEITVKPFQHKFLHNKVLYTTKLSPNVPFYRRLISLSKTYCIVSQIVGHLKEILIEPILDFVSCIQFAIKSPSYCRSISPIKTG